MITEKTLELNVTHEILSLGNAFTHAVASAIAPPMAAPQHEWWTLWEQAGLRRPQYAVGLSLQDEKNKGWDVRIQFPPAAGMQRYALFLQFKAGDHRGYSTKANSLFNRQRNAPTSFCQFGINNNNAKNQHHVLRALSAQPNLSGAVAYVFPRIPNAAMFKAALGRIIHLTTFISVDHMDALALAAGTPILRGHDHHYNVSYVDPGRHEICSTPTSLPPAHDMTGELVGEILACQAHRTLSAVQTMSRSVPGIAKAMAKVGANLFRHLTLDIARYLAVPPDNFIRSLHTALTARETEMLVASVEAHDKLTMEGLAELDEEFDYRKTLRDVSTRELMFDGILRALGPYGDFCSMSSNGSARAISRWFHHDLQPPKTKILVPIPNGGLEFDLEREAGLSLSEQEIGFVMRSISYQAI